MVDSEQEPEAPEGNPKQKEKLKRKFIRWWSNWQRWSLNKENMKEMKRVMRNSPTTG